MAKNIAFYSGYYITIPSLMESENSLTKNSAGCAAMHDLWCSMILIRSRGLSGTTRSGLKRRPRLM